MNSKQQQLTKYLIETYTGIPVIQEGLDAVAKLVFPDSATRFDILMAIDEATAFDPSSKEEKHYVNNVIVVPLADGHFGIEFSTGAAKQSKKEGGLFGPILGMKCGPQPGAAAGLLGTLLGVEGFDGEEEVGPDYDPAEDELTILKQAVDLVQQIEQHWASYSQTMGTNKPSALLKYIPQIEKLYIKPFLSLMDESSTEQN